MYRTQHLLVRNGMERRELQHSHLCVVLSERWHMQRAQHLLMPVGMDRGHLQHADVLIGLPKRRDV